jgi:dipeptidyl aminopeptidase/acylaminoacyl peptidase
MFRHVCCIVLSISIIQNAFAQTQRRPLQPGDIYKLKTIGSPVISPDGKWVAYTVSSLDSAKDKKNSDIWMVSWDGKESMQLTHSAFTESDPQFSPDGKFISFLSGREGEKSQVWLLDRRGGEAVRLTDYKTDVEEYRWKPDSKQLLLVMKDTLDTTVINKRKPYVINRYRFKEDIEGYQYDTRKSHLYLFDIDSKKSEQLTSGIYNESDPQWSPSGDKIAFVSNRTKDPDRNRNTDIWLTDARKNAEARQLTTWAGSDEQPKWSPDGKRIAYVRTTSDANSEYYEQSILCVVNREGGDPKLVSKDLDRVVSGHHWSKDGNSIAVLVADDTHRYIGVYDVANGTIKKLADGDRSFLLVEPHSAGMWLSLMAEPTVPGELYAVKDGEIRKLTNVHNNFTDSMSFAHVEKFVSTSKDGTKVSGLLFYPLNSGRKNLPLVIYLHGGPVSQDEFGFDMTRQMLAAHGYAVAAINYRGSSGRGLAYSHVITGDWGNKEVIDIIGATDYLIQQGIADSTKLGIAGWSYGGILTDYTIATDTRFKAASSGAGVAAPLSLYGVDMYTMQYDNEIGQPWKEGNLEKYIRMSYPFLHADRIKTPTQFMGGEKDFNVPIAGSEQMYQALRSLDIPTELIIYPGQYHGFTQPSFIKDRYERYFAWFDKYLNRRIVNNQ